jgi:UDP-glucose 4-epimerase
MCRQAILTKTIQLRTSGLQVRNFLPISRLLFGVSNLIESAKKESLPLILNFGGHQTISVIEAAEIIQRRCEIKFGFSPNIKTGSTKNQVKSQYFEYASNYPKNFMLCDSISLIAEIDAILNFVVKNENNWK